MPLNILRVILFESRKVQNILSGLNFEVMCEQ